MSSFLKPLLGLLVSLVLMAAMPAGAQAQVHAHSEENGQTVVRSLESLRDLEEEFGDLRGKKIALTWVYSPSARPLAVPHAVSLLAAKTGMHLTVCAPTGYELDRGVMEIVERNARETGGTVRVTDDPREAAAALGLASARAPGDITLLVDYARCLARLRQRTHFGMGSPPRLRPATPDNPA